MVLARALAKGRGETYDPRKHGPFDAKKPPRQQAKEAKPTSMDDALEKIMARFSERGPKYTPKFVDRPTRPGADRVRNQ